MTLCLTCFSVLAASSIANIVKSSLGPVGLDKMLVDDVGVRSFYLNDSYTKPAAALRLFYNRQFNVLDTHECHSGLSIDDNELQLKCP